VLAFFELPAAYFPGPPPSSSVPLALHKSMAFLGLAAFPFHLQFIKKLFQTSTLDVAITSSSLFSYGNFSGVLAFFAEAAFFGGGTDDFGRSWVDRFLLPRFGGEGTDRVLFGEGGAGGGGGGADLFGVGEHSGGVGDLGGGGGDRGGGGGGVGVAAAIVGGDPTLSPPVAL